VGRFHIRCEHLRRWLRGDENAYVESRHAYNCHPANEDGQEGQQLTKLTVFIADEDRLLTPRTLAFNDTHEYSVLSGLKFMEQKRRFASDRNRSAEAHTAAVSGAATPPHIPCLSPKKAAKPATHAREGSKKAIILDLLRRPKGATLDEVMKATKWQAHSVRGFIAGPIKRAGWSVESTKTDAARAHLPDRQVACAPRV
jgi:hypothetical protein